MSDRQFSILVEMIHELGRSITARLDAMDERFDSNDLRVSSLESKLDEHIKQSTAEHIAILKTIESCYLSHDKRITKLERAILM